VEKPVLLVPARVFHTSVNITQKTQNMITSNGRKIRIIREKAEKVIRSACYMQKDSVKAYIVLANKAISKYSLYEQANASYAKRTVNSLFDLKFSQIN
jgi:hypothetical protein